MTKPQVFGFELLYDDGGGTFTAINLAYDRDTALQLAAIDVLECNEWVESRAEEILESGLTAWLESELTIVGEWGDLNGTACPNCTSHSSTEIEDDTPYRRCNTCFHEWTSWLQWEKRETGVREAAAANLQKKIAEFLASLGGEE